MQPGSLLPAQTPPSQALGATAVSGLHFSQYSFQPRSSTQGGPPAPSPAGCKGPSLISPHLCVGSPPFGAAPSKPHSRRPVLLLPVITLTLLTPKGHPRPAECCPVVWGKGAPLTIPHLPALDSFRSQECMCLQAAPPLPAPHPTAGGSRSPLGRGPGAESTARCERALEALSLGRCLERKLEPVLPAWVLFEALRLSWRVGPGVQTLGSYRCHHPL